MARPVWTSFDSPAYTIAGSVIKANQGNWMQGQGAEPLIEPRFVFLWHVRASGLDYYLGEVPPPRSYPDVTFIGEGKNTLDLAAFPGVQTVSFSVYAGSHYTYLEDWYEWGTSNVITGAPYIVSVDVPAAPVPPPVSVPVAATVRTDMIALATAMEAEWQRTGKSPATIANQRITIARAVLGLPLDANWLANRDELKHLVGL